MKYIQKENLRNLIKDDGIGNSIFHLSLELLTKFWKTSLKVA